MIRVIDKLNISHYNVMITEYFNPELAKGILILHGKEDVLVEKYKFDEGRPCFTNTPNHFVGVSENIDLSDVTEIDFVDAQFLLDKEAIETMHKENKECPDKDMTPCRWTIS